VTERVRIGAGGDLHAAVEVEGALTPDAAPAPPDVGRLPGARIEGFAVVRSDDGLALQIGCARAPSDRWVPGLEGVVMERATSLALGPLSQRPASLHRGVAPRVEGATAIEAWTGEVPEGRVVLAHVLAFAASADRDALVCSAVCLEPAAGSRCEDVVASLSVEGTLGPPPPPGALSRLVLWSAEHPLLAAGGLGIVSAAVMALLLARRPRRPIASRRARAARR
jgi:hypothetical protein